ncbi:unnamed protein product, partial [Ectocarpus sp. 12 AP-2014]
NIWTGFNTTFEGENKVFQKTEIPFYVTEEPVAETSAKAEVYDAQNRLINIVETKKVSKGLNYIIWKMDEASAALPGAWKDDFSRDIPVLPGEYTVVLSYASYTDTTKVTVIPDPRFDLEPNVDEALYAFRKEVDGQVALLSKYLKDIDGKKKKVEKLTEKIKEYKGESKEELNTRITDMKAALHALGATGRTPKPERQ